MTEAHASLAEAQLAVMRDVEYIQRTKSAELGYSVLMEGALLAALRPAMIKHGIVMRPSACLYDKIGEYVTQRGSRMAHAVGRRTFVFKHASSGEEAEVVVFTEAADTSDKTAGKMNTYAKKFALREFFGVEVGEDELSVVEQRGADNEGRFRRAVSALKTTRSAEEAAEKLASILGHKASNWTASQVDALDDLAAKHVQWLADTSSATAKRQASELK